MKIYELKMLEMSKSLLNHNHVRKETGIGLVSVSDGDDMMPAFIPDTQTEQTVNFAYT